MAAFSGCTANFGAGSLAGTRHVRETRRIASEVDAAVAQNRLRKLHESVECDAGAIRIQATLFTEASGTARKYVLEGATGDSSEYLLYYYDEAGTLRLIDSDQRAAGDAQRTSHFYFDAKGKLLHKDERASGPRHAFSGTSERRDPLADMRSLTDPAHGCRKVREKG